MLGGQGAPEIDVGPARDVSWSGMSAVNWAKVAINPQRQWLALRHQQSFLCSSHFANECLEPIWAPIARHRHWQHMQEVASEVSSVSPYLVMHTPLHLGPVVIEVPDVMMTVFAGPWRDRVWLWLDNANTCHYSPERDGGSTDWYTSSFASDTLAGVDIIKPYLDNTRKVKLFRQEDYNVAK